MKFNFLVAMLAAFCLCLSIDVQAKGGFRGGSFSRSMSSPKISSSKPKFSSPKAATSIKKSEDISSLNKPKTILNTSNSSRSGAFGNSAKVSTKIYENEKSKYSKKLDTVKSTDKSNKVYIRKPTNNNIFYKSPPPYVYNTYPSFGGYDTLYLMFLLNSNPAWFYHHSNDADVAKFKDEARELAKSNEDLKKKLDEMDSKVKELEDKNEVKDVNYEDSNFEKVEVKDDENYLRLLILTIVSVIGVGFILFRIFLK